MKNWLISAVLLSAAAPALADEGMWQPHQLPAMADVLKAKGLQIDPDTISTLTEFPMNAVISLGGCTASFVSPKGLVVTNHHCAYGAIQYNSTAKDNLLKDGFLARQLTDELPATPGSRIYVTKAISNVTEAVTKGLADKQGKDFYRAVEDREKALVAECEQGGGYRCEVYSFHRGLEYYLVKQLEIRDVRLVYNPAGSVGKYGGDIDNWMWPRHTGDFAFYRAYVGPDGQPADYSPDNVPFTPDSFLKVSAKGVQEGEFVMVTGYPGRTNRYRTAAEVENQFGWTYPNSKALRETIMTLIRQTAPEGSDARIKYESTLASLANYAKNFTSMIEFYGKSTMLADKIAMEEALAAWINADTERQRQYGSALTELNTLIARSQQTRERDLLMAYMGYSQMLSAADRLYRLAHERQKPDMAREPGYQSRDMTRFKSAMERIDRRYDAAVDQAILQELLAQYAKLPAQQRLTGVDKAFAIDAGARQTRALLTKAYANTELANKAARLGWMEKSVAEFKQSDDPFIQLAVARYDTLRAEESRRKTLSGELMKVRPLYMDAIIGYNQSQGKQVYADANSSLRVSIGKVTGYAPQDGLYAIPFTRLEGILAKDTGVAPFDAPPEQLALIKQKQYGDYYMPAINSVPVNFLSTLDTTGGNSGSPTLNGRAELVGLLFDGVYESIIGDWNYDPRTNRSIQVDSRYMLWVMEYLDKADNLLAEMVIVK